MVTDSTSASNTARSPWRVPAFRLLAVGSTVDSFGSAMSPVALAFAVLRLGGDATALGLVVAAYALADVVTSLAGGVLGDRFSRTMLMTSTALAQVVVQGTLAWAVLTGRASIGLLGSLGAVSGAVSAIGKPSAYGLMPLIVPSGLLSSAISWQRLGRNVAVMAGFGTAGVLVDLLGPGWAIAADATSFLVAALCYWAIRAPAVKQPAGARPSVLGDIVEGAREVFAHTWLWALIAQASLYHLVFGGVQGVLGPVVVGADHSATAWGVAMASLMLGFAVGTVITLRWRPKRLLRWGTACLVLTAAFPLGIASGSLALLLAGAFLHGLGLEVFSVNWELAIQQRVPTEKLSRVSSFDMVGSFVMRPLGLALTGPVAGFVGVRSWLLIVAALMACSALAAVALPSVNQLERLP